MAAIDIIIAKRALCDKTGEPLTTCSICGMLCTNDDFFAIAKAYHKGKLALEAMQCFSCQVNSKAYASEHSMENIMLYSGRRFNEFLQDRFLRESYHLQDPSCLITGEELAANDSFELYTFNVPGSGLGENNFIMVGPTAMEQMSELLSKETRESWSRYTEQLAPDSPEIFVSPMFIG